MVRYMVWSLTESMVMSALISETVVSLCGSEELAEVTPVSSPSFRPKIIIFHLFDFSQEKAMRDLNILRVI